MNRLSIRRRSFGAALATAGLLSLACGRAGTEIVVQGSPTFLPVGRPALAAYRPARQPSAVLLTAGSAEGVRALLAGTCDIAALARDLTLEESRRVKEAGADLRTFQLGYAAAVPVVQSDNPVTSLTLGQLRGIWSGAIRNWKEAGGSDLPIHVVTREAGSALSDLWDDRVMGGVSVRADAKLAGSGAAGEPDPLLALVGRDPAAIGFAAMTPAAGIKGLAVGGIAASEESVRNGSFPIGRALSLLLDGRTATDTVQGFVDFLLEPEGQRLIRRAGYLPT
jgi:phosphate transport system substrate-binding protein